jgi:radical SAM superfamily enzyme YgiQ (UPF0313 family)
VNHPRTILLFHVRRAGLGSPAVGSDYLGLFYLAAVLETAGWDPWVFHGGAHEVPELLKRESDGRDIAAVGFSCDFENQDTVETLCRWIKDHYDVPVVVGGPQAYGLESAFLEASGGDVVIRGEAEETLPQVLHALLRGSGNLEDIPGITWLGGKGELRSTPDQTPVSDLDSLPFPAYHRSLHPDRLYGRNLFTGRGCPFSCAFCHQSTHKKRVRLRSMDRVFAEIRRNLDARPDLKYITVLDDTFTLNPGRVEAFCREMQQVRKERDLVWYCESHVHLLARWPEMIPMMAESGLIRLQIGVETGNEEILKLYGKQATPAEMEQVVAAAASAGIPQMATNLIIGGPMENDATIEVTAAFAERLLRLAPGVIDILTGFLRPYPGTAITERPADFGLTILDPRGHRAIDDYPVVVPKGTSPEVIAGYRRHVSGHIRNVMRGLVREGAVPRQAILSQYRTAFSYGIHSLWYVDVYKENLFLDEYFRLITRGAARSVEDVPVKERMDWRPQRTVEMRKALKYDGGVPRIAGYVLSPMELELLLHCAGKISLKEVLTSLEKRFGERFPKEGELQQQVEALLRQFDQRHWVVLCKW